MTVKCENIVGFWFCFGVGVGPKLIWQLKMEMGRGEFLKDVCLELFLEFLYEGFLKGKVMRIICWNVLISRFGSFPLTTNKKKR